MKYVRIQLNDESAWGQLTGDQISLLSAAPYEGGQLTGKIVSLAGTELLAPCSPTKVVAVGKNYHDHIKEFDAQVPERPILFIKPTTSIIGPNQPIQLPDTSLSQRIDFEGELALVIGRQATKIKASEASQYILGYTILNDVTARDIQKLDGQWTRAKGFDTFCPIGPYLSDEVSPDNLQLTTTVNGHVRQHESTAQLIWSIGELLAFITQGMTLLPGDVVTTGTPAGVGPLSDGDLVAITIEGLGTLSNPVTARA